MTETTRPEPRGSTDRAAHAFARLVDIMKTLRAPNGCPWDREQTWQSLSPFVLEETYEVIDAIDRNDVNGLRQELGDLIFEAVFLAQVASDGNLFDVADSLEAIADKLVRRHPHVFDPDGSPRTITTARDVEVRWEELKAAERAQAAEPHTTLSGIARTLPSLLRAYEIGQRAAAVGFDWNTATDVMDKVQEELTELRDELSRGSGDRSRAEEEMGDLLFAIANLSRKLGIEPEAALRKANDKFTRRFDQVESAILARQQTWKDLTLDEMEREWTRVKEREHGASR
jgi:nucleoside triphosphate diphosphatase